MSTPFSDIFKKYGILAQDSELLSILDDEEYTELLELFLSKSKSIYFKNCDKDLSDVDEANTQFNETISEQEQWIIASGMRLVWLEQKIYREEKLKDKIGNRDYVMHSPANLIDKLIALRTMTKRDLDEMIVSYSFDSFEGFN